MKRREFLTLLAGGLVLPYTPERIYSFGRTSLIGTPASSWLRIYASAVIPGSAPLAEIPIFDGGGVGAILASGVASFARYERDGETVCDLSAGPGCELNLSSAHLMMGQELKLTSFQITQSERMLAKAGL
jgi:hypothetical protein